MSAPYRKKKRNVGPSKNEEKVSRAKELASLSRPSNSLGSRFPGVTRMTVRLEFISNHQQLLSQETRVFGPSDSCNFSAPCPGTCGVGDFDLAGKVAKVVESRQGLVETSGLCQERLFAGSKDLCGTQLKCRLEIEYAASPSPSAPA